MYIVYMYNTHIQTIFGSLAKQNAKASILRKRMPFYELSSMHVRSYIWVFVCVLLLLLLVGVFIVAAGLISLKNENGRVLYMYVH